MITNFWQGRMALYQGVTQAANFLKTSKTLIMENYKNLEEANKEVERSKAILHETEDSTEKKEKEANERNDDTNETKKEEGSGIFTADGKELPDIEGGYDLIDPGGNLGDDEFVSI